MKSELPTALIVVTNPKLWQTPCPRHKCSHTKIWNMLKQDLKRKVI